MEENKKPRIIIIGLGNMENDYLMEVFYNLIVSSPDEILNYNESSNYKIEKINNLLKYFEEKEEFEKCIKIKKVKDLIILNNSKNGE